MTISMDLGKEDSRKAPFASSDEVRSLNALVRDIVECRERFQRRFQVSLKVERYSDMLSPSRNVRSVTALSREIVELAVSRSNRALNCSHASFAVWQSITTVCNDSSTAFRRRPRSYLLALCHF